MKPNQPLLRLDSSGAWRQQWLAGRGWDTQSHNDSESRVVCFFFFRVCVFVIKELKDCLSPLNLKHEALGE